MASEASTSILRVIAILDALGSPDAVTRPSLGVVEIANRVGREKSQVSRTLKLLADAGYVDRDPETLGYRLGWRLYTLSAGAAHQRLLAAARPVLRALTARTKERVHLNVLDGDAVLTVMSESPLRAVQAVGWVGRTTPLLNTASGRALLFGHDDAEIRALFDATVSAPAGPRAPRTADGALARVRRSRTRGYDLADEEFEAGLVAAAAPVYDIGGRVVASVNLSAPKFRLGRRLEVAGRQVKAAADRLTRDLTEPPDEPSNERGAS